MATNDQRTHLAALMRWTQKQNALIDYSEARPMSAIHLYEEDAAELFAAKKHIVMDCSGGVTQLCKWAGLKDPMGRGYDGFGNTDTLLAHLPHYGSPADANVGALALFHSPDHVAMVLQPDPTDPLLWSHGDQAGPLILRLSAEKKFHQSFVTFLSIAHL